jgi:hypothetical protein
MDTIEMKRLFEMEFGKLRDKFEIYNLPLTEAEHSQALHICKPGVYVFWHPRAVIKVGRHFANSRKRAFEHLQDNTGGKMGALRNDPDTRLLLFNVKEPKNKHWVAALEVFFEEQLSPEIKSGRLG